LRVGSRNIGIIRKCSSRLDLTRLQDPEVNFPGSIRLVIPQNEALSRENWRTLEQT